VHETDGAVTDEVTARMVPSASAPARATAAANGTVARHAAVTDAPGS
jgi:hypothetical protein